MSKIEKIAAFKLEYPVLTKQINTTTVELELDEYEATIEAWVDAVIAKETALAETEAKAAAKVALLDRLGITADEAALLLS
jgi:hypothetical protein